MSKQGKWYDKLVGNRSDTNKRKNKRSGISWLRSVVSGSFYKMSDLRGSTDLANIKTQIDTMRALANDSQISTALSYYATDATTPNSSGQIIWATAVDKNYKEVADIINGLFKRWDVNTYARDHILELATIGNLYIPTTDLYAPVAEGAERTKVTVGLDTNTIENKQFDIVPSYKLPPEDVVHLWYQGTPQGYILQPDEESLSSSNKYQVYPESSIIHFSLGGLLGEYELDALNDKNEVITYDIKFAQPLMERAVQPTQTLTLLEDALLLSSLTRIVKFINVDCGNSAEEDEIRDALQQVKDAIEQQLSLNTSSGDAQSFVNPQSPNNLIFLPKINGQDAITITDLKMTDATEADNYLLDHYQDKKLSVLGVPKEAMNFSSAEGLGNAGSVMSQRSALYANALSRLGTAYIAGWTDAINKYFEARGMSGFIDKFELHMNPILTEMSALSFEKRDAAIAQAQSISELFKALGVEDRKELRIALKEILAEVLPKTGAAVDSWDINMDSADDVEGGNGGEI